MLLNLKCSAKGPPLGEQFKIDFFISLLGVRHTGDPRRASEQPRGSPP